MKRILLGLFTIAGAATAIGFGATGAFFGDTESSLANLFKAGELDLLVDNESYYNGNKCTETSPGSGVWQWQGNALFPVPGTPCDTSWPEADLNNGVTTIHRFFNFTDIKPDDDGEDTISLHVQNDAWMCMNVTLTSNDDNDCTGPETLSTDPECVGKTPGFTPGDGVGHGELAGLVQMLWWADDGDNVYEQGEQEFSGGVKTLLNLTSPTWSVALADSQNNVWTSPNTLGPVPANQPRYIGKAWCFGTLTPGAVAPNTGNPVNNPGWSCDGVGIGNESQTDSATLDVEFRAVQARHNPDFVCNEEECLFSEENPGPNLVLNGGFEVPEVSTVQNWDIFDVNDGIPGWSVEWRDAGPTTFGPQNRPTDAQLELHEGVLGVAFEGDQYAELDSDWEGPTSGNTGEPASISIYQNIATVAGATYQIRYRFAPRPNTPAAENRVQVRWGGAIVHDTGVVPGGGSNLVSGDWTEYVVNVAATGASMELRFTDMGTANSLGSFIDDVRVFQIGCPNGNGNGGGGGDSEVLLFSDNFGNGTTDTTFDEPPGWTEGGAGAEKRNAAGGGNDSASSNGGRFATVFGTNGWICTPVNASGISGLALSYLWRGDTDAEAGDSGIIEYATSGTCAAPGAFTPLATHALNNTSWNSNSVNLPGALDNSSFLLRFRTSSSSTNEHFRIDGVNLTGTI